MQGTTGIYSGVAQQPEVSYGAESLFLDQQKQYPLVAARHRFKNLWYPIRLTFLHSCY